MFLLHVHIGKGPTKKKVNGDTTLDHVDGDDDDDAAAGKQGALSSDEKLESDREERVKVNDVEMAVDDEKMLDKDTNNGNLNHES